MCTQLNWLFHYNADSHSVDPGWGLRFCISYKLPGDADVAGMWIILWEIIMCSDAWTQPQDKSFLTPSLIKLWLLCRNPGVAAASAYSVAWNEGFLTPIAVRPETAHSGGSTMTAAFWSLSFKTGNGGWNLAEHPLYGRHCAWHLTYSITSDSQHFGEVWV